MPPVEPTRSSVAWLLREFLIIVALSSVCLLAIIQTVQYHVRVFLADAPPCASTERSSPCTPSDRIALHLADLSPLDVLTATTICGAVILLTIEVAVRVLLWTGWVPARCTREDDVEACVAVFPVGARIDSKSGGEDEPKPRLSDVSSLSL
ncbi:hypothetical protein K438DRAFT_200773 [Mycena galopus ATCC 62051]|nr:hypothetical protein K438DRAFT_227826 [Mycena galopus ATCC 62051]KAF8171002.1 hypothetical protein K438DRAFT_200773 [Mycena galopus ATCC 62051]